MKKFLYISVLLLSSSMFAMQQTNKKQMPMNNKKPFLTKQEIGEGTLTKK